MLPTAVYITTAIQLFIATLAIDVSDSGRRLDI